MAATNEYKFKKIYLFREVLMDILEYWSDEEYIQSNRNNKTFKGKKSGAFQEMDIGNLIVNKEGIEYTGKKGSLEVKASNIQSFTKEQFECKETNFIRVMGSDWSSSIPLKNPGSTDRGTMGDCLCDFALVGKGLVGYSNKKTKRIFNAMNELENMWEQQKD